MSWSENGAENCLSVWLRNEEIQTNLYMALVTSATAPGTDTGALSTLTQIATGNGYVDGGITLSRNTTDFDVETTDGANNIRGVQIKDLVWTASGGPIPASGGGARYSVLTGDNVTPADRLVYAGWDLSSDRTVSDGQTLTLQNCELQIDVG